MQLGLKLIHVSKMGLNMADDLRIQITWRWRHN